MPEAQHLEEAFLRGLEALKQPRNQASEAAPRTAATFARLIEGNVGVYAVAFCLYLIGVWFHIPYGGGHVYSDIVTVFQSRECASVCSLPVPYIQSFIEYPVITAMFMYSMGVIGSALPGPLLSNYYIASAAVLSIPSMLSVREIMLIAKSRGVIAARRRTLVYFVLTPTFVLMLLVNWYVIGLYFGLAGLRIYLEGRTRTSGFMFGLSAASNLVTAVPALGLLISSRSRRDLALFVASAFLTYLLVNSPFFLANPQLWSAFWTYSSNWYIEGSWMLVFFSTNTTTPLRHVIFPVMLGSFVLAMVWFRFRKGVDDPVKFAFVSMFAYIFSTYIYSPQLNLLLLPFFVLLPITTNYWEFLTFDAFNSAIIVLGFSQVLQPFGLRYDFHTSDPVSFIWAVAVIRSLWVGKFAVVDGLSKILRTRPSIPSPLLKSPALSTEKKGIPPHEGA